MRLCGTLCMFPCSLGHMPWLWWCSKRLRYFFKLNVWRNVATDMPAFEKESNILLPSCIWAGCVCCASLDWPKTSMSSAALSSISQFSRCSVITSLVNCIEHAVRTFWSQLAATWFIHNLVHSLSLKFIHLTDNIRYTALTRPMLLLTQWITR